MEVELLKAQREESKMKDASLIELSNQVKQLRSSSSVLIQKVELLSNKCADLDSLNRILSTENQVCLSMLFDARSQHGQGVLPKGTRMSSVESPDTLTF
jgi:hypothetical protein